MHRAAKGARRATAPGNPVTDPQIEPSTGLGATPLPGVASLGVRPTVKERGRPTLEVHLFDFAESCYGKLVRVEFLEKIRDEEKYNDLDTLTAAIARDSGQARDYFAQRAGALTATDRI